MARLHSGMRLSAFLFFQRECRADQPDMRERLWEISQSVSCSRINLFSKQSEIVSILQKLIKKVIGFLQRTSAEREILHRPEAAYAKCSLRRLGPIAKEQAVTCAQLLTDFAISALHTRRLCFFKAVPGEAQQSGIDAVTIEDTYIALQAFIPCSILNLVPDAFTLQLKLLAWHSIQKSFVTERK